MLLQHAERVVRAPSVPVTLMPSTPDAETLWAALCNDAGSGVMVIEAGGRIRSCNGAAAELLGASADEVVGKSIADFFSAEMGQERVALVRRAADADRPLTVDGLIRGRWVRCTHRALGADASGGVLMVLTQGRGPGTPAGTDVVRATHDDAGAMASLTGREIEILRLIGEGKSTAEIAAELHRSVKTIEWHRVSLGTKLKQSNRVGLARVAIRAGLTSLETDVAGEAKAEAKSAS